jgi:hypothetical protein
VTYNFDENTLSDLHKDARGFRPRSDAFWARWNEADNDGKQAIWDGLIVELDASLKAEKAAEQHALHDFDVLVEKTIEHGAGDRETALRWLTQGDTFDHSQDVESWVWAQGILFTGAGRALVKELLTIVDFTVVEEAA